MQFVIRNPNFDSLNVGMDALLKRAAVLYERANLEDKAIETYQNLVKIG